MSGSLAIDEIYSVDQVFGKYDSESQHTVSLNIKTRKQLYGGTAGNISHSLAMMGERPTIISSVGGDAEDYLRELNSIGVDIENIYVSTKNTARFIVFNDNNHNQIGGFFSGALDDFREQQILKDSLVIVSANNPQQMNQIVEQCIENKIDYIYDPGQQTKYLPKEEIEKAVKYAKFVFLNNDEYGEIKEIINSHNTTTIITDGSRGATIKNNNENHVPAVRTENIIDTTGAGDAFRAGFIFGFVNGYSIEDSCKIGSSVASRVIQTSGGRSIFTKEEIIEMFKENYGL